MPDTGRRTGLRRGAVALLGSWYACIARRVDAIGRGAGAICGRAPTQAVIGARLNLIGPRALMLARVADIAVADCPAVGREAMGRVPAGLDGIDGLAVGRALIQLVANARIDARLAHVALLARSIAGGTGGAELLRGPPVAIGIAGLQLLTIALILAGIANRVVAPGTVGIRIA